MAKGTRWSRVMVETPGVLLLFALILVGCAQAGSSGFDELNGARGITTVTVGSSIYALVASQFDDGAQIIEITNPESPLPTGSVSDGVGGFNVLQGAAGVTAVTVGSSVYALVASFSDDGVQTACRSLTLRTLPARSQRQASPTESAALMSWPAHSASRR